MAKSKSKDTKKGEGPEVVEEEKTKKTKFYKSKFSKIFGELFGYGISLLFLFYIFPRLSFVTDKYQDWQMIGFWATTISVFLKLLKHSIDTKFFKHSLEIGSLIVLMYSTRMLFVIYPLDFSSVGYGGFDRLFRFALVIAIFAMALAILVNFIQAFLSGRKKSTS